MSPRRAKNRRTEPADVIEVPSSPSDPDMSLDAGSNPFAIERRETAMSRSDARSDPQRLVQDQRNLEMEAEIFRLRTALNTEAIAGQQRIQEVHAHSRTLTRNAMAQQHYSEMLPKDMNMLRPKPRRLRYIRSVLIKKQSSIVN